MSQLGQRRHAGSVRAMSVLCVGMILRKRGAAIPRPGGTRRLEQKDWLEK
jgi:hypothetical protein